MRAVVFVTANDSVTVDGAGRQAGGRDWVVVDTDDQVTAAAIDRGQLRVIDRPDDDATLNDAAQAAFDALDLLDAAPQLAPSYTDDQLAGMTADDLVHYVTDVRPDEKQRVYDLEMARSKPRSTVISATSVPAKEGHS